MALKALMLGKKLSEKNKALDEIREKLKGFEIREKELEKAIDEAETDEERNVVEESVDAFEKEKAEAEEEARSLEEEVDALNKELEGEERKMSDGMQKREIDADPGKEIRKDVTVMNFSKRFKDMTYAERTAFVQTDEMQTFLKEIRSAISEKRTISNAGYLIPKVMLGLLRANIEDYSKLYGRVDLHRIKGEGRMVIEGTIPEAVWTEACANLNELDLSFGKVEVDGYKVGGYFKICNATLEDSDIDLAEELISVLGRSIGYALDKAILYGTGTKMPVGIVKALSTVADTPNIVSHANTVTGKALVQALVGDIAKAKGKYSRGVKTWVMNETTYSTLLAQFVEVDASGAYVSVINGVMPVVGGDIVVVDSMPDNTIVAGYMDLYLLAERSGVKVGTSEHAFWVADQTGFKGTARYDGNVLQSNAFVAIGINGVTPATNQVTFASDSANL